MQPPQGSYVLVLVAASGGGSGRFRLLPAMWCVRAHQSLARPFRKNVRYVILLQPSLWVRSLLAVLRPVLSTKAAAKIRLVRGGVGRGTERAGGVAHLRAGAPCAAEGAGWEHGVGGAHRAARGCTGPRTRSMPCPPIYPTLALKPPRTAPHSPPLPSLQASSLLDLDRQTSGEVQVAHLGEGFISWVSALRQRQADAAAAQAAANAAAAAASGEGGGAHSAAEAQAGAGGGASVQSGLLQAAWSAVNAGARRWGW